MSWFNVKVKYPDYWLHTQLLVACTAIELWIQRHASHSECTGNEAKGKHLTPF